MADKLLKLLANRLRRQLRSYDALGRYSDDEFVDYAAGMQRCRKPPQRQREFVLRLRIARLWWMETKFR